MICVYVCYGTCLTTNYMSKLTGLHYSFGTFKEESNIGYENVTTKLDTCSPPKQPAALMLVSPSDRLVAMDCEMVGIGRARCTILSYNEWKDSLPQVRFVRLTSLLTIKQDELYLTTHYMPHTQAVKQILNGKICIGHDLSQDFAVIGLSYLRSRTRGYRS